MLFGAIPVIAIGACANPEPAPPVPPASPDLVRRHHDQVCRVDDTQRPAVLAAELFDTDGLTEELLKIGPRPFPLAPGETQVEWGQADYVVRYGRDGRVQARGVWDASVDEKDVADISRVLAERSHTLPGLLAEEGFRAVVTLGQPPTIRVESPLVCTPHVKHPDGGLAYGLPEGVRTMQRRSDFRVRSGASTPGRATVRISLDAGGNVDGVEPLNGDPATVAEAVRIVGDMRFDPALRNGVGIASTLVQTFFFDER